MNRIPFPLKPHMKGAMVADLQGALQVLLERAAILASDRKFHRQLLEDLPPEHGQYFYRDAKQRGRQILPERARFRTRGIVEERTVGA